MSLDKSIHFEPIESCREWVERVVVGLGLCPFASAPLLEERVRFAQCGATDLEGILQALGEEIAWLESPEGPQTTLLIVPNGVGDFDRFLDLVGAAEDLLRALGKEGVFQLAHFHPDYCFEGSDPTDPANLTNRSPVPILHLLRWDDVAEAVASHSDPEGIPGRNIVKMRQLGAEGLRRVLALPLRE